MKDLEQVKGRIQNLVAAINLCFEAQNVRGAALRVMSVDFGTYCNVYVYYANSTYKKTMYRAMNYREVEIFLDGYLEGLSC